MITFYHRFVPAAASILEPLFKLLAGENKELSWDSAASFAFENAKEALAKATMLVHLKRDAPSALTVDASETAVGGALEQLIDDEWRPIALFSRCLN